MSKGVCTSCGAEVFFAHYKKSGKPGIFDTTITQGGTGWAATPDGMEHVKGAPVATRIYQSHYASCKDSKAWKEKQAAKRKEAETKAAGDSA